MKVILGLNIILVILPSLYNNHVINFHSGINEKNAIRTNDLINSKQNT